MPENQAIGAVEPQRRLAGLVSDGLMRVQDAALFLGLSRSSVYKLMERGELLWVKLGRARRIPRRAVIGLAAGRIQGGVFGSRDGVRDE